MSGSSGSVSVRSQVAPASGVKSLTTGGIVDRVLARVNAGPVCAAIRGQFVEKGLWQKFHDVCPSNEMSVRFDGRDATPLPDRGHSVTGSSSLSAFGSKRTSSPFTGAAKSWMVMKDLAPSFCGKATPSLWKRVLPSLPVEGGGDGVVTGHVDLLSFSMQTRPGTDRTGCQAEL